MQGSNCINSKGENVTLHFDTTSQSNIDGRLACFNDIHEEQRYNLRTLFFAYEDRENIAKLIIATYERLAVVGTSMKLGKDVTSTEFWKKTSNFMTDAATKNLKVETLVAEKLSCSHKPIHTLCKSHVEKSFTAHISVS
jgi:hypothetical protein